MLYVRLYMGTIKEDLAKLLKLRQFKADYLAKIEAIKKSLNL